MRLERSLRLIFNEPWLLPATYHANLRRLIEMKLSMPAADFQARERGGEGVSGEKVELPSMQVVDGIAHVPFAGVLVKGATLLEKGSGALAHEDVEADLAEAVENPEVRGILFHVDSPGGTAAGSFELADLVAQVNQEKPTWAWIERLCCSGALLSLAGCEQIYGSKTSEIGAVECYMAWLDSSVRMEQQGYRMELVKNTGGEHVAAGMAGHPLTKAQRAQLQSQVDQLFGMYQEHLHAHRQKISDEHMDGRTFIGHAAKNAGFMDTICTRSQCIAQMQKRVWF